jgi:2,5-furandicarboxylate decarboxylase 1
LAKDLSHFLQAVRDQTGDLLEIDRSVRPGEFEVTALLKQIEERRQYPAVLFNNPIDLYGARSPFPLLSNMYATRERCAVMLGVDPATPNYDVSLAFKQKAAGKIKPTIVSSQEAPVRENLWQGMDADVGRLPIVKHFAQDMGPVLTMTHVMRSKQGHYNCSFAKTFYKWDPREMVVSIHTRDLSRIVKEYEIHDEPAPIVNVIGHHPAFHFASLARNPWGAEDYETIGSFLDEPLRLTPSATWGDKFMVPADAEIIIEGEIPPGQRDVCDPFGEVGRLYQAQCLRPVFNVKAISFRNGAIMQDIFSGFRDCFALGAIPKEAAIESALRARFPNLHAVHSPDSSCGIHALYISVRDLEPGQADAIGKAALEAMPLVECAVVVDSDINVFHEPEVLWAVYTYADVAQGLSIFGTGQHVVSNQGTRLSFATTKWSGRVVVDATRPRNAPFPPRSEVPPDVIARVQLDDFLPGRKTNGYRARTPADVK